MTTRGQSIDYNRQFPFTVPSRDGNGRISGQGTVLHHTRYTITNSVQC